MRLLLIEDEEVLGRETALALGKASFTVDWVKSGREAVAAVQGHEYDVILLDLGLPDMTGEDFVKDLRSKRHATPVIVLTARGQVEDRVAMLDLGADDYLVKPFNMAEVGARLRAVKRRTSTGVDYSDSQRIGPLELFQAARTARWNGTLVTLTSKEFDVLETLVMRRPRVVSRSQLENALYGWGDEVESNAIEVYIHFLRRKFSPSLVVTVRGKGYQLGSEESLAAEVTRPDAPAS